MATHFSVLAWRIPGTGEPGGLPSMGSHRVGHDWSGLAAAGRFLLSCFLVMAFSFSLKEDSSISCKANLVLVSYFSLCISGKLFVFFSSHCYIAGLHIPGCIFFFLSALYHATLFWPSKFLLKNQLIALWGVVCMWLSAIFSCFL